MTTEKFKVEIHMQALHSRLVYLQIHQTHLSHEIENHQQEKERFLEENPSDPRGWSPTINSQWHHLLNQDKKLQGALDFVVTEAKSTLDRIDLWLEDGDSIV
jgi:hypothetical protein